jgi:urease accessory protein
MAHDAQQVRGTRPVIFTNCKTGQGISEVGAWIERELLFT